MPTIIDPKELEFRNKPSDLEAFDLLTLTPRLSKLSESKQLVFDIRKLNPGKYSFPYHFHHNAEELIMIISGSMTLRDSKGIKIIEQGQLVFFEMGENGAHQFYNHGSKPCTYFDLRTNIGIDVTEYPDSGKVNILPMQQIYEKETQVDYNMGEENIKDIWMKYLDKKGEE